MKWKLFIISFVLLTRCAPKPPDVPAFESLDQHVVIDPINGHVMMMPSPACMEMIHEPECGHGVYIVSGREIFVGEMPSHLFNGKKWSYLKSTSVYLPAKESYAPLANYIINSCKKNNCNNQVDSFKVKLDMLKVTGK